MYLYSVVDLGAWRFGFTLHKAACRIPDVNYAVLGTAEGISTYCRQCEIVVADQSTLTLSTESCVRCYSLYSDNASKSSRPLHLSHVDIQ